MLNLNTLIVFSENPEKLMEFYKQVLQKEPDWSGGQFYGFKVGVGFLTVGPHSEVHGKSADPERIIFNFETDDVEGEMERIKGLGAEVIAQPYHPGEEEEMMIATLADPDGNYFQLVTPMNMENMEIPQTAVN